MRKATTWMKFIPVATAAVVALAGKALLAQDASPLSRPDFSAGSPLVAAGYDGYPYHSSTLQEGLLRGHADVLRSSGQRDLLHHEALRSREAAIEHRLNNAVLRLDVRQRRELMGLQHRETIRRLRGNRRRPRATEPRDPDRLDPAVSAEKRAAHRLHLADCLMKQGRRAAARRWFQDIVESYEGTAAARDATLRLANL
jgi:hypothetical protein